MKYSVISKFQSDEVEKKMNELKTELMKLNAQVAIGTTPKSTKQIREIKKNIARIETLRVENFKKALEKFTKEAHKPNAANAKKYINH